MDLTVVVPLYNEEESVAALHAEIGAALDGLGREAEVLYVDDGSRDGTFQRLRAIAEADPRVKVLRFRRNYGQTAGLQAGFDHARGAVVITLDGDLQNDPADFRRLLDKLAEGYDVVCGWRYERQDAFSRRLPSIVANWLIGALTGTRIHDNGCTLKAYRAAAVKRAHLYAEMHRFMAPLLSLSGSRVTEIPVNHRARRFGASKYGFSRIWKVFLDLLTVRMLLGFTTRPSAWFGLLALPFLGFALLALAASLWTHDTLVQTPEGGLPLVLPSVAVLFAFSFAHLLFVGVVAELVVRVGDFKESETVLTSVEAVAP
ncbi:MAG TPA: glycosyltransferase family 2 protein [Thermoanaerobaculia bacterium]|nr:glycosyltransferase family 2 protein [Thermoanaerobaculia bacterium]